MRELYPMLIICIVCFALTGCVEQTNSQSDKEEDTENVIFTFPEIESVELIDGFGTYTLIQFTDGDRKSTV